jgi:hypothetical protein
MKPPPGFEQYLASDEYDQGTEINARATYGLSLLQNAKAMMQERPEVRNQTAEDLYRQQVERFKAALASKEGACQCLAIKWLKIKMKEQANGKTGNKKVKPNDRLALLRDGGRLDRVLIKMSAAKEKQTYIQSFEEAMKQYKVQAKPHWNGGLPLENLCKTVMKSEHGYFVVGINCPNLGGNHAIAVYTSGGGFLGKDPHAYVFDPNIGELKFKLDKFNVLFPKLISGAYGSGDNSVVLFAELTR